MPPPDPPGNKPAGSRSPRKNDRPHMPHVCPGLALSAGSEDLHGSLLSFSAPCFVRCAAELASLAVLRCTLLEVLDLLAQPPKLKKSPGKVGRRHGVVWRPNI